MISLKWLPSSGWLGALLSVGVVLIAAGATGMPNHLPPQWGWLFVAIGLVLELGVTAAIGFSLLKSLAERRGIARQAAAQEAVKAARSEARRQARAARCSGTPNGEHRYRDGVCLACRQGRETSRS